MTIAKQNLNDSERDGVLQQLLQQSSGGKLKKGAIGEVAKKFAVCRQTIGRIWKRAKESMKSATVSIDVSSRISKNSGRKKKDRDPIIAKIAEVPLRLRGTLRSMAHAIQEPLITVYRIFKEGRLKRVSNSLKPRLTDQNKHRRLEFALSFVDRNNLKFNPMFEYVHVDEKWFYITKIKQNHYMLSEEEPIERSAQSKRFITKVMFIAAVARPRWDPNRKGMFDGKLGIWPFVYQEEAKRASKNRPRGTLVTKNIESVNKTEYVKALVEKVIPAIKQKWPKGGKNTPIKIQQDNAKPHCGPDYPAVAEACASDGWKIHLTCQPPNSPDCNVLDLGFFAAIQSLQQREAARTIDELIAAVVKAFDEQSWQSLDNVFLSLQNVLECIMNNGGGNGFKLPHMGKEALRRQGALPESIECEIESIENAWDSLQGMETD
jgi:hypothetical protein